MNPPLALVRSQGRRPGVTCFAGAGLDRCGRSRLFRRRRRAVRGAAAGVVLGRPLRALVPTEQVRGARSAPPPTQAELDEQNIPIFGRDFGPGVEL